MLNSKTVALPSPVFSERGTLSKTVLCDRMEGGSKQSEAATELLISNSLMSTSHWRPYMLSQYQDRKKNEESGIRTHAGCPIRNIIKVKP